MTEPTVEEIVAEIVRDVAELPDRTSPPDEPMMLLVTERELQEIAEIRIATLIASWRERGQALTQKPVTCNNSLEVASALIEVYL